MEIDHIFIFSSSKGQEVDELVEFGLTEGSGRTHSGIGTINKRIFFENFYLEILWVQNPSEAKTANPVGILERSNYRQSNFSPFGLCLANTRDLGTLFEKSIKFQPDFLPEDKYIEIMTNERMPWIFKFPSTGRQQKSDEPTHHKIGLKALTKATFNLKVKEFNKILDNIEKNSIIGFMESEKDLLVLEFDNGSQGEKKSFEKLNLEIHY